MGLKNDLWIIDRANEGMITPFAAQQIKRVQKDAKMVDVVSYGVSSYGYDMRVSNEFKIYTNLFPYVLDPKSPQLQQFHEYIVDDYIVIPPNSFALARSVEYFNIPRNVLTVCIGKSTYARIGIVINVTCFEPEWCGQPTIEISNTTPLPAKIYANEGIGQVLFFEADEVCTTSYKDKHGKYQGDIGIVLSKV